MVSYESDHVYPPHDDEFANAEEVGKNLFLFDVRFLELFRRFGHDSAISPDR